eukprot:CAMPEP_0182428558 /NCGR_PEP_ID=MMETSP1167-20130531/23111_1 /TAXON_ID=2988 /ORGANISM="Mallomonas Sp, Strain CCMP3275" /LENGTH=360 /DNA_ID=CAMNT_0024611521 /DNA_START=248 /DNA_END=1330 /DNA_ORIENTATION=+
MPSSCDTTKNIFQSQRTYTRLSNSGQSEINIADFEALMSEALTRSGLTENEAKITSATLMYAELRGNNQGLVKLLSGALIPNTKAAQSKIHVLHQTPSSAVIDGGQKIGMAIMHEASSIAIKKAKVTGIAVVSATNYSSATGAIGCWARKISDEGLVGIVMSQCPEMVAPYGSYEPVFGTNPISIAVPTKSKPIVLDMATSAAAWFGVVAADREGSLIPGDIAYDEHGKQTCDPSAALKGALRVFDRGHKGSGLALMIELLAGAMTGAAMSNKKEAENWGSLLIAIDPVLFGPPEMFLAKVEEMCARVKAAQKLPGVTEIMLPGEQGNKIEAANLKKGYLSINTDQLHQLLIMAGKEIEN